METTTLTLNEIERMLLRSPMGRELIEAQQREADRKVLVAEIAALRTQESQQVPPLKEAESEAWRECERARATVKKLEAEWRNQVSVRAGVSSRLQHAMNKREHVLRQSASPMIEEFQQRCRQAVDAVRASFVSVNTPTGAISFETARPIMGQKNNAADIALIVQRIERAIVDADALKLQDLTDSEVIEKLQALAAALPADAKQQALTLIDEREYGLVIGERSEMIRQSLPWKDIKRRIHEASGGGSFRERRRS